MKCTTFCKLNRDLLLQMLEDVGLWKKTWQEYNTFTLDRLPSSVTKSLPQRWKNYIYIYVVGFKTN